MICNGGAKTNLGFDVEPIFFRLPQQAFFKLYTFTSFPDYKRLVYTIIEHFMTNKLFLEM